MWRKLVTAPKSCHIGFYQETETNKCRIVYTHIELSVRTWASDASVWCQNKILGPHEGDGGFGVPSLDGLILSPHDMKFPAIETYSIGPVHLGPHSRDLSVWELGMWLTVVIFVELFKGLSKRSHVLEIPCEMFTDCSATGLIRTERLSGTASAEIRLQSFERKQVEILDSATRFTRL